MLRFRLKFGFTYWNDIQASKVQHTTSGLRKYVKTKAGLKDLGEISAQTYNFYLKAVRQLCKWMVQDGRASGSPLEYLKCKNIKKIVDEKHPRRALEIDELRHLFEVTKTAPRRFGMDGYERYLLYWLTAETGLRANEQRSLKVASFDFNERTVRVSAKFTKNGQVAIQDYSQAIAVELKEFFRNKLPNSKAFGGTYKKLTDKTANMLKADLADANIPYVVDGLYFDFHALRHQTGTLLAAADVHPKVAQEIMRHSDINLTMLNYTHTLRRQKSGAISKMPDLSLPSKQQKSAATGTEGKVVDAAQSTSEKSTQKSTLKSTHTAYSGCNQSATVGNEQVNSQEKASSPNCLGNEKLDNESDSLSANVIDKKQIRPRGLEPLTFGLGNRCSILLSYGRFIF